MCGGYNFICYNVNLCVIIIRVSRKKRTRESSRTKGTRIFIWRSKKDWPGSGKEY